LHFIFVHIALLKQSLTKADKATALRMLPYATEYYRHHRFLLGLCLCP